MREGFLSSDPYCICLRNGDVLIKLQVEKFEMDRPAEGNYKDIMRGSTEIQSARVSRHVVICACLVQAFNP